MAHGGVGCISVSANVAPRLCSEFQAAMLAGDYAKALEYQDRLMPLHKAIFMEPGVCGTKYALSKTRGGNRRVRSPLMSTLEPATEAAIDAALKHAGLMN
jgi:4-hydroxy-tetrahydrodipicolinate synthase